MKKAFRKKFVKSMFLLIITVLILSMCSCSSNKGTTTLLNTGMTTFDFEDSVVLVKHNDSGASFTISEENSQYIANLIHDAEFVPDILKLHFDYEFVTESTTWMYCSEVGGFSNLIENISFQVSESEKSHLSEIIAATSSFDINDHNTWYEDAKNGGIDDDMTEKIKVGMTFSEVVEIIGKPQRDTGTGAWVMEWDMKSGKVFVVCFNPGASDDHGAESTTDQSRNDLISYHIEVRDK